MDERDRPGGEEEKEDSAAGRKGANNQDVKRWAILILVCLLLGVVTTYGIAWGIVCWGSVSASPNTGTFIAAGTPEQCWWRAFFQGTGAWRRCTFFGPIEETGLRGDELYVVRAGNCPRLPGWSRFHLIKSVVQMRGLQDDAGHFQFGVVFIVEEDAVGFPWPATWRAVSMDASVDHPTADVFDLRQRWFGTARRERSALPHETLADADTLPLRPLWAGFVIDTGLWSLAWGTLYAAVVGARRRWNRWRGLRYGLCLKCGYDLTGNTTGRCPECGAEAVVVKKS